MILIFLLNISINSLLYFKILLLDYGGFFNVLSNFLPMVDIILLWICTCQMTLKKGADFMYKKELMAKYLSHLKKEHLCSNSYWSMIDFIQKR